MTPMVKSLLTHITHIQKIAKNSTCASTELNHVNLDAQQEKFSTMTSNVVTFQKMFPDGNKFIFNLLLS
jgi:hypothetical protein